MCEVIELGTWVRETMVAKSFFEMLSMLCDAIGGVDEGSVEILL